LDESERSTRPAPRTPAAIEAELRRRLRAEIAEAREAADGELTDTALAGAIAHAIGQALGWHVEADHARGPSVGGQWRPAPGPRGRPPGPPQWDDRGPPPGPAGPPGRGGPPAWQPRGGRPYDPGYGNGPPPRGDQRPFNPGYGNGPPPRGGGRPFDGGYRGGPPPGPRDGRRPPPSRGGGFGPRRLPPPR